MIKIIPFLCVYSFFITSLSSQTNFKLFHNLNLPLQQYSSDTSSFHMLSVPFISFDMDVYSNPGFQKFFSKENNNLIINLGNYKNNITGFSHHMLDIKNHLLYFVVKSGNTLYSYGLDHSLWMETSFSKDIPVENISVSPNPFKIGVHNNIIITNVSKNSIIKIMTLNGKVVKEFMLSENNRIYNWDGKDNKGRYLSSGVYLVSIYNNNTKKTGVTKLAIIK